MSGGPQRGICCLVCLAVSHHPQDVANLYCGQCRAYLADGQGLVWAVPGTCPRCGDYPGRSAYRVQVDLGNRLVHATYSRCWHQLTYTAHPPRRSQ